MIRASGLSFSYEPGGWELAGIDVELAAGDLLFVLGPNGSGKSTLLELLCGCRAPAAGEVRLGGQLASELDARELARRVAVVPQSLDGVGAATVEGFVAGGRYPHLGLWRRPREGDRDAVRRALERAELTDLGERRLDELSGGQRQRALVARALAQEAPALLLDEPTAALDPEHQIHLLELVRDLARAGSAVMVVTHDLNLTSQFASRVLLLDGGRKVAEGPVERVLTSEVLEPVYGQRLLFERFPGSGRPLVVPWSRDGT